jgi:DNA-binding LytR/AlgR family response regulator
MIRAIAIDDEPPSLEILKNFSSRIDFIDLQKTFTKPSDALKYLRKFPIDLVFLDIQMPSMTGIEAHKSIDKSTKVIFTTAYSQYAVDGFELQAVDFLLKPYTFERFLKAVERAKQLASQNKESHIDKLRYIYVRADYSLVKINVNDILYVEGLDDYLKIHILNQKSIVVRMTMKSMLSNLPKDEFVRIHRSFIIPLNRIVSIRNKMVVFEGKELPIGISYEEEFIKRFTSKS